MAQKSIDEKIEDGHGSYSQGNTGLGNSFLGSGGTGSDDSSNDLRNAEDNFNNPKSNSPDNAKDLNSQESEAGPAGGWNNNTTPRDKAAPGPKGGLMNSAKTIFKGMTGRKKGAIGAIVGLVFGAGLGFSALFSPGMLIVHMKEVMTEKLDTTSSSLNTRSGKLLNSKIDGSTAGLCTGTRVTVMCRFSTLSEKNVQNLKAAGIDVVHEPKTLGRYKPTAYKFTDSKGLTTTLTANEFERFSRTNPEFSKALKQAYNPRFSQFTGRAWSFVSGKLGIDKSKTKLFQGTDEEKMKEMNNRAKQNLPDDTPGTRKQIESTEGCADGDCAARNAQIDAELDTATRELEANKSNASKTVRAAMSASDPGKIASAATGNAFKVTGVVDNACMAYGAVRAVGYAAKTVRALQLASYAMTFLKVADEIKAGTADAETVAYLGGLLTAVSLDVSLTNKRLGGGSATESFGFKNLAYGDISADSTSMTMAGQYLAGGGFTGELISFTDSILNALGANHKEAREVCKTLANPWIQGGSLIAGIGLMIIPGGQAVSAGRMAAQLAGGAAMSAGLALLPALMADIVAGTTTDDLIGQPVGDAVASGVGIIESGMGQQAGGAMATVDQAVQYASKQGQRSALVAEEDRATLSPFDVSSKYTFMGSIVHSFIPLYASAASTPSKLLATLKMPLSAVTQKANATSTENLRKQYTMCTDLDYRRMEIATDVFCNPIFLIPEQYLGIDPLANAQKLLAAGEINEDGEPTGEFATFVKNCIQREAALGFEGDDLQGNDGESCKIDGPNATANASRYVYWMDYEAELGMSDEQPAASSGSGGSGDASEAAPGSETHISENSGNITTEGWAYPLDKGSYMRSDYENHIGNDMPKPVGTKVYAIRDGVVKRTEVESAAAVEKRCWQTTPKGAQNNLYIESVIDGVTYTHRYAHLDRFNVRAGQPVKAGDLVGYVGFNGCTTGPHLHIDLSVPTGSGPRCAVMANGVRGQCYIMIRTIFGSSW